jgi:hypothetical protein
MKIRVLSIILAVAISSAMYAETVEVVSPNGGEGWQAGSVKQIKWNASGTFTEFSIVLYKDNKPIGDIAKHLSPTNTSYDWKTGDYTGGKVSTGSNYKIKVTGYFANGSTADQSNGPFTITRRRTQFSRTVGPRIIKKIKVTNPTHKSKWETTKKYHIRWRPNWRVSRNDVFFVKLYNANGKRFRQDIGKSERGASSMYWTIPHNMRPDFYKIRVSTLDTRKGGVEGFSERFHVSVKMKLKQKVLHAQITNKTRTKRKAKNKYARACQPDPNPGKGKALVGYRNVRTESENCLMSYRSFAYFNLDFLRGKRVLLTNAKLVYDNYMGKMCKIKIYILEKRWWKNTSLFKVKANYHGSTRNFKDVVQKWLAFPHANYGIVFVSGLEDLGYHGHCLTYLQDVKLILTYQEAVK